MYRAQTFIVVRYNATSREGPLWCALSCLCKFMRSLVRRKQQQLVGLASITSAFWSAVEHIHGSTQSKQRNTYCLQYLPKDQFSVFPRILPLSSTFWSPSNRLFCISEHPLIC